MKFSVAIPSYNRADCLGETLEAILGQSLPPAEIVVADDGSKDDTQAVLDSFKGHVRSVRIENSGPGIARKTAIESTSGDWIATCDSDDLWVPTYLERKAALIRAFPGTELCLSNFASFGAGAVEGHTNLSEAPAGWLEQHSDAASGEFHHLRDAFRALLYHNPAYPSGIAFTRRLYDRCGGIDPHFSRWLAEDSEFTRRLALHARDTSVIDQGVCWRYRRHPSNFSTSSEHRNILAGARILEALRTAGTIPPDLHHEVDERIIQRRLTAFARAYWAGCSAEALAIARDIPPGRKGGRNTLREWHCRLRQLTGQGPARDQRA